MDTDRLKRRLLLFLVVAGVLVTGQRAAAATGELVAPAPLVITASGIAEERLHPRPRPPQFRARLLRHWWQPRIFTVVPSRRPAITKII